MYIYQNGKLYRQVGENIVVGVSIYSDHVIEIMDSKTTILPNCKYFTQFEVECKFNIKEIPYIFPQAEKKPDVISKSKPIVKDVDNVEKVVKNDTTGKIKGTTRKRRTE